MTGKAETFKVEAFTRLRHGDRVLVFQAGETIPLAFAVELGLAKKPAGKAGASKPGGGRLSLRRRR